MNCPLSRAVVVNKLRYPRSTEVKDLCFSWARRALGQLQDLPNEDGHDVALASTHDVPFVSRSDNEDRRYVNLPAIARVLSERDSFERLGLLLECFLGWQSFHARRSVEAVAVRRVSQDVLRILW